jgi:hypothetical protein
MGWSEVRATTKIAIAAENPVVQMILNEYNKSRFEGKFRQTVLE